MKSVLKGVSIFILALFLALGGLLIPSVQKSAVGGVITSPVLTTNITSPANGAVIKVGSCFTVNATVSISCSIVDRSFQKGSLFSRPVYAIDGCNVRDVTATITITGNAVVNDTATKNAGTGLNYISSVDCPTSTTFSWNVCCTGPGAVTITVTPYGVTYFTEAPCSLVQPVFASAPSSPIPSENLISDSITITQVPKDDFYENWLMDSGGASMGTSHNVRATNVWAHPQTLQAGQKVIIYANMANKGDLEGPYTATLKINGVEEAVKSGILQGNTAVPLQFIVNRNEPGTYHVDVNGKTTFFTIVGNTAEKETLSKNTLGLFFLWGFLLLALVAALVIILLRRRQTYN